MTGKWWEKKTGSYTETMHRVTIPSQWVLLGEGPDFNHHEFTTFSGYSQDSIWCSRDQSDSRSGSHTRRGLSEMLEHPVYAEEQCFRDNTASLHIHFTQPMSQMKFRASQMHIKCVTTIPDFLIQTK
jgi:hypothetical protein